MDQLESYKPTVLTVPVFEDFYVSTLATNRKADDMQNDGSKRKMLALHRWMYNERHVDYAVIF
jgi:hypothetical protein